MRVFVKAKAGARENKIVPPPLKLIKEEGEKEYYVVSVKEPPLQGKANIAIKKILAEYFAIALSQVTLIRGESSKIKIFEITN